MKCLRGPRRLLLLVGGVGLLLLIAAVSAGPAGVIGLLVVLLVGLAGAVLIPSLIPGTPGSHTVLESQPLAEEAPTQEAPWDAAGRAAPSSRTNGAEAVSGGPDQTASEAPEPAPTWGEPVALPPAPRSEAFSQARERTPGEQTEEMVVAEVTTYQPGQPPVVRQVWLRLRVSSVPRQTAPPSEA